MRPRPRHERGYAMLAVVGGIAVMATIAATMAGQTARRVDLLQAESDQARLSAAADAGVWIALDALARPDIRSGWAIDGQEHRDRFAGVDLSIRVEDEHGKILLSHMNDDNVVALMHALGKDDHAVAMARDGWIDWTDDDDDPSPDGAESAWYAPLGVHPRGGVPTSIDELADIRGWGPAVVARIRPYITADVAADQVFDQHYASPLAVRAMVPDEDENDGEASDSVDVIKSKREAAGQRTAIDIDVPDLKNRVISIVVRASAADGSRADRRAVVQLTRQPRQPFVLRYIE